MGQHVTETVWPVDVTYRSRPAASDDVQCRGARDEVDGLMMLIFVFGCFVDSGELGIDEDASAVFADDDFFAHFDFELFLRRDAVETTTAGVALDVDDAEAVAGVFADALERGQGAGVDHRLEVFCLFAEALFVLAGFGDDFLKLGAFFVEDVVAVGEVFLDVGDFGCFLLDEAVELVDVFLG